MERLLLRRSTVGFDAEWRPDAHGVRSEPSLLQLAEETGDVWLLDVASTPAPPLAALHSVMASDAVRVLGFGFAADFERCRTSPSRGASSTSATRARRRRRPERRAASRSSSRSTLGCASTRPSSAATAAPPAERRPDRRRTPPPTPRALDRLDALDATAARDETEYRAASPRRRVPAAPPAIGGGVVRGRAAAADAEATRGACARRRRGRRVRPSSASSRAAGGRGRGERACVRLEGAAALVLAPAAERVNLRWLAEAYASGARRRGSAGAA